MARAQLALAEKYNDPALAKHAREREAAAMRDLTRLRPPPAATPPT